MALHCFSCSWCISRWSCCCSAFSCNRGMSSEKIFHFDNLCCGTQVICQIVVALLGKYKQCQEKVRPIISEKVFFTFLKCLNCGSLQQCGQYHPLGSGVEIAKQDRWNSTSGHWGFPHFRVFPSDGILQKHIPAPACGISSDISHFLEYHLPKISGKIYVPQKVVGFGKTAFMWPWSG